MVCGGTICIHTRVTKDPARNTVALVKKKKKRSHYYWLITVSTTGPERKSVKQLKKAQYFTFTGSLQVSFQAAGKADVLGAAKSSSWTAGGAQEFSDTIFMVVTTTS